MDYLATANAIAARFTSVTAPSYSFVDEEGATTTVPDDDIRVVSATIPNQLAVTPALYVMPPEDREFEWGPNSTMHLRQFYLVRFVRDQTQDMARRMAALQAWRTPLALCIVGKIQLDLAYVDWAELRSGRLVEWTVGEITYDAIEMTVEVKVREQVAASA